MEPQPIPGTHAESVLTDGFASPDSPAPPATTKIDRMRVAAQALDGHWREVVLALESRLGRVRGRVPSRAATPLLQRSRPAVKRRAVPASAPPSTPRLRRRVLRPSSRPSWSASPRVGATCGFRARTTRRLLHRSERGADTDTARHRFWLGSAPYAKRSSSVTHIIVAWTRCGRAAERSPSGTRSAIPSILATTSSPAPERHRRPAARKPRAMAKAEESASDELLTS